MGSDRQKNEKEEDEREHESRSVGAVYKQVKINESGYKNLLTPKLTMQKIVKGT